ncbi:zinc finger protein 184-like isoform X2 [Polypterus senegalus]|uniref:zinc finger protein 184-like isoform X2 n=1 Tax=Polypterus senegalus TaxID=55291 RepID=UPI0019627754|nr:zinc finger protein 184-like isoform X2 [Polypterus senegalus]
MFLVFYEWNPKGQALPDVTATGPPSAFKFRVWRLVYQTVRKSCDSWIQDKFIPPCHRERVVMKEEMCESVQSRTEGEEEVSHESLTCAWEKEVAVDSIPMAVSVEYCSVTIKKEFEPEPNYDTIKVEFSDSRSQEAFESQYELIKVEVVEPQCDLLKAEFYDSKYDDVPGNSFEYHCGLVKEEDVKPQCDLIKEEVCDPTYDPIKEEIFEYQYGLIKEEATASQIDLFKEVYDLRHDLTQEGGFEYKYVICKEKAVEPCGSFIEEDLSPVLVTDVLDSSLDLVLKCDPAKKLEKNTLHQESCSSNRYTAALRSSQRRCNCPQQTESLCDKKEGSGVDVSKDKKETTCFGRGPGKINVTCKYATEDQQHIHLIEDPRYTKSDTLIKSENPELQTYTKRIQNSRTKVLKRATKSKVLKLPSRTNITKTVNDRVCYEKIFKRGNVTKQQQQSIHAKETNPQKRQYHGTQCPKSFTSSGLLKNHQLFQSLFCSECGKNFRRKHDLQKHERVHTGERPYSCVQCGKSFTQTSHLYQHQRRHTSDKPCPPIKIYNCTECGMKFTSKNAFQLHQRIHTKANIFSCAECGKKFTREHAFQKHQQFHAGEKTFMLGQYKKKFPQKGLPNYEKHQSTENPCTRVTDKLYCCTECGKTFTVKYTFHQHQRIHTGENLFYCADCGKKFIRKHDFQKHQRVHTGERPYCCEQCGKKYKQISHLRQHQRSHTGQYSNWYTIESVHCCRECGKTFTSKSGMQNHQKSHRSEDLFSCNDCGKEFKLKANFQKHLKVHFDGKAYYCKDCGKTFVLKSEFQKHQRVHNMAKAHCCTECGRKFTRKCELEKHSRIHDEEKPRRSSRTRV